MLKSNLREHLLTSCTEEELQRWFDPLRIDHSQSERAIKVVFPHAFFADWFSTHIQEKFEEHLSRFLGNGYAIHYRHVAVANAPDTHVSAPRVTKSIDFPFGHQFTFDNFLVNKKNYFPLASAREVAKPDNIAFNPFIICGDGGSGKTHLIKAIANELSKNQDTGRIFLGTVEDFSNHYYVRHAGDLPTARQQLHDYDFLLLDDFHRISNHEKLQQEIVLLFNYFYDNKKQMVFTCSDKVSSLDFLDPNLKSRLEWGLIVNLKQPDMDIRVSFIRGQCKLKNLPLTKEQILTLAQRFHDFRYLQGIMLKLFAFKELVKQELGDKDFERILNNTEDKPSERLSADLIMQATAKRFGLAVADLKGNKRYHNIALARQVGMYLCRQLLGTSYPALGRAFGGKDHSTVLYSVKKIKELQNDDSDMKKLLSELKNKCLQQAEN